MYFMTGALPSDTLHSVAALYAYDLLCNILVLLHCVSHFRFSVFSLTFYFLFCIPVLFFMFDFLFCSIHIKFLLNSFGFRSDFFWTGYEFSSTINILHISDVCFWRCVVFVKSFLVCFVICVLLFVFYFMTLFCAEPNMCLYGLCQLW